MWLFKQAQLDVVILEVGLGGRLDATNIVDADVAVVTSIALDHTDWLGPDRESIGREKAGIFRSAKPAIVGEPEMPSTIADVAQEKVHCYNVGALSGTIPSPIMTGRLAMLTARWKICRCRLSRNRMPQQRWRHCVPAGWKSVKCHSRRDCQRNFAGTFPDCERVATRYFDVAHNPHAAEYLTGRMKALPKNGRVLAVIGMLHDKDIAGTLAWLKAWLMTGIVRHWKGRAVPRQNNCLSIWVTANHLIALRRHGMPQWRTLKRKTPCWCVVLSTRSHMSWK